jgi:hypothetical protein
MNPSRLVINVDLRMGRTMLHLTLDLYTIITWNLLIAKVFPTMNIGPQCLNVCTCGMPHNWGMPWKIG